ncbi:MAG: Outer-membrane lipoprotein carrier protein [Gemmatimonadaceae bacterium]|nr:Outer-membrane lipoprotein carrier protein [Gemmatimonadaceae bacterium]
MRFAILVMILPSLLLAQDGAGRAIDLAVASYATIRTARATFEQQVTNPLTGSTLRSKGEFEQARPDRFVFTFSDPKGDAIVSDGKFIWVYLPSSAPGQVLRSPMSAEAAGSLDLIGEFFSNPRSRYTIGDGGRATLDGRDVRVVSLTPKGTAAFTRAKVWIDAATGTLRQFEAEEASGIVRLVKIVTFTPNAKVDASAFTFSVPRGVRIVAR